MYGYDKITYVCSFLRGKINSLVYNKHLKGENNTMKRNFLALFLAITISAACLTGCGGTAPTSDNVASETTETNDSAVTDTEISPDAPAESAPAPDNNTSETPDEEKPAEPETAPEEPSDDGNTNQPEQTVDGSDTNEDTAPNKGEADKTDKPTKPDKPSQTDKPDKPVQTDKPNKTDKPTKPSKPDETDKDDAASDTGDFASSLYQIFETEIEKTDDIEQVAAKIVETGNFGEVMMGTMPVEEGYLAGFEVEIKGFKKGVTFGPMIGTIPFVGYIFETDTPDELVTTLEKEHKLNWNICTSADRMFVRKKGNYVFFVMSPDSFGNN